MQAPGEEGRLGTSAAAQGPLGGRQGPPEAHFKHFLLHVHMFSKTWASRGVKLDETWTQTHARPTCNLNHDTARKASCLEDRATFIKNG